MIEQFLGFEKPCSCGRTHRVTTQHVWISQGVAGQVSTLVPRVLPPGKVLVVMDDTIERVLGRQVLDDLTRAGIAVERLLLPPGPEGFPVASSENVDVVTNQIDGHYVAGIAVGSGTINDVVKLATFRASLPYVCIATAPSMNGFTSAIAAILDKGVKTTVPCHATSAVIADADILAAAPQRMIASGLGDLLSKPVSNADWRLSAWMIDSWYCDVPYQFVQSSEELLRGVPERLGRRDPTAAKRLMEALCLSGMAMAAAGSSSPASGGEHLISHYLDMTAIRDGVSHDFHGCQVGVATTVTASMYQFLRDQSLDQFDVERCVARFPSWDVTAGEIDEHFGVLGRSVRNHARVLFPDHDVLRRRLTKVLSHFDDLIAHTAPTLRPCEDIRSDLTAAKGPIRFADLGVDEQRARDAIRYAPYIRSRYTILHLMNELGLTESWMDKRLKEFL